MVEMLGTLAIIGVLSVGGITGYRYAMAKLKANQIISYVNQLAILGHQQMTLNAPTLDILDYKNAAPNGYNVSLTRIDTDQDYFEIDVDEVENDVCQEIKKQYSYWPGLSEFGISDADGNETNCNSDTPVTLWFLFSANGNEGRTRCSKDEDCGNGCQTCQKTFCVDTDTKCSGQTPYCVSNTCSKCPRGEMKTRGGYCKRCDDSSQWFDMFGMNDGATECAKCPNRTYYQKGSMYTCSLPCQPGEIRAAGVCGTCDNPPSYWITSGDPEAVDGCLSCPNHIISSLSGFCYSCFSSSQTFRSEQCGRCTNRIQIQDGNYLHCAYPCLSGETMYNYNKDVGLCSDCETETDLNIRSIPEEHRCTCSNRYIDGDWCKKCPEDTSGLTPAQQSQCNSHE